MCLSSPPSHTAEGCIFHPVGQPLSAEWPDMLIIGCFHRPPLRLMRLHHQLLGLLHSGECCWVRRHPVSLLIPPHLFPLQDKKEVWERSVRGDLFPKLCPLASTHRVGCGEGWVFVWMHLTACRFRTPAWWKRETGSRDILPGKGLCVCLFCICVI